nr:MAG TPA: hypothetical protein [Caudoviricetes sp.]
MSEARTKQEKVAEKAVKLQESPVEEKRTCERLLRA